MTSAGALPRSTYEVLGADGGLDVTLSYIDMPGEGGTVVLVHGYGSSAYGNWVYPGLHEAVAKSGFRVIIPDLRGHGQSTSPQTAEGYPADCLATDLARMIDGVLGEDSEYLLVGYSMGATVAASVAVKHGARVNRLVLAGNGDDIMESVWKDGAHVGVGLLAADEDAASLDPLQQAYRAFVVSQGGDLTALAYVASHEKGVSEDDIGTIGAPTLILCGTDDPIPLDKLPGLLSDATIVRPPGDHISAPATPEFAKALVDFLFPAGDDVEP